VLVSAQHAVVLLQDPHHGARGRHLFRPCPDCNVTGPSHVMLRTQAVRKKSLQAWSGLLTWHPSASTADSLLYCNVLLISISIFGGRVRKGCWTTMGQESHLASGLGQSRSKPAIKGAWRGGWGHGIKQSSKSSLYVMADGRAP
jgi:hypothetical protein